MTTQLLRHASVRRLASSVASCLFAFSILALGDPVVARAQSVPHYVQFDPSADQDVLLPSGEPAVSGYQMEFTIASAATPFLVQDIGKPAPGTDGTILYDLSATVIAWPVAGGSYVVRVVAVGPNGVGRSDPSPPFVVGVAAGAPQTYEVGDGKAYASLADVPWDVLAPGSTVRIAWKSTPYLQKIPLTASGTASAPIIVQGVLSGTGARPVLDAAGATSTGTRGGAFEALGLITVTPASSTATPPAHIVIENLEIRNARAPNTFVAVNGTTTPYATNAAGVYLENAEDVLLRNCVVHDNGQGVVVVSSGTGLAKNVTLAGNYVYANGIVSSAAAHNVATEADGMLMEANRFGPLLAGARGHNVSDRSAGLVLRYNWIEGGDRELDLVDARSPAVRGLPSYQQALVYGNVLYEPAGTDSPVIVRYGGDSGTTSNYRQGWLYFYNNTVVSARTTGTTLLELSTNLAHADVRNDIAAVAPGSALVVAQGAGIVDVARNWFSAGYVRAASGFTGTVTDPGAVITGSTPGFVDATSQDFGLASGSAAIDVGVAVATAVPPTYDVTAQYVRHQQWTPRPTLGTRDLGAFEAGTTATAMHTVSGKIADTAGVALSGVTVTLTGAVTGTTTTGATGTFTFTVPRGGTVTLTPSKAYVTFAPTSVSLANVTANLTANFTGTVAPNAAPTVTLTSPVHGSQFSTSASIPLAAAAADADGKVVRVDFYRDATKVASDTTAPYAATLAPLAAGSYTITATAVDDRGASKTSVAAVISVVVVTPIALTPLADAYVMGYPSNTANFGKGTQLAARASTSTYTLESYLTFDVTSVLAGRRIVLRLLPRLNAASTTAVQVGVYSVADTAWSETALTYDTRPASGTTALGTFAVASTTAASVDVDVSSYVLAQRAAGKTRVSVALRGVAVSSAIVVCPSREAASGRPQLIVQ